MEKHLLDVAVENVRKRVSEGDCPTTPAYSQEWLENMVIALADDALRSRSQSGGVRVKERILAILDNPSVSPEHDLGAIRQALSALEPSQEQGGPVAGKLLDALERMVATYEGQFDADAAPLRPDWLNDALALRHASPQPAVSGVTEAARARVLAWVRDDVLPAYGITHDTRASDPEMIEGLTAALSQEGEE